MRAFYGGVAQRLRRAFWLLPLVVAAQQVGNEVPRAEACSGGEPGTGWQSLAVADAYPLERVPIATDGFVLLRGVFRWEDVEPELALPRVTATDAAGDEVPGELQVLRTDANSDTVAIVYFGWQPDRPLDVGDILELRWSRHDDAGQGGVELEVVGDPAPLPTPQLSLGAWLNVRHGVGERVACDVGVCGGPQLVEVSTQEERLLGVQAEWVVPAISGMVAWAVWAETSEPQNGVDDFSRPPRLVARNKTDAIRAAGGDYNHLVGLPWVTFDAQATDYCVVMVIKDLRTGEEVRSEPQCDSPGAPRNTVTDNELENCNEPPTAESLSLWCQHNAYADQCQDLPAAAGAPGDDGHAAAAAGDGGASFEQPETASGVTPSGGCQLAAPAGGLGALAAASGVLLAFMARRRRAL